ncbi:molybdopterin-dependent oxidoreductase [Ideonella sp. 4Y16]|uniref:bifunctional nitrate reductase/sulfite reductase flavoprotein subunit alpha n=1 Tax=Ideonella alba TaxID=2824118 RepID=UPI001B3864D9|nr:bifunctional nitrate reductase/sulfite reductase flavoprotein subunit alpha [Ideonella alba]MBQ0945461.1 molybdopterin-dependent oxidoreductase [Ideonella alba]
MDEVRSVCPYCGVGCGIVLERDSEQRIIRVRGDVQHPANRGRLCTKGQTCAVPLTAPGRMDSAYLRHDRSHEPVRVPMDSALRETGQRLRALIDRDGPDAVALYVSGQMSIEAQYLANKLAKGYIGTHQIESNSRLCMASAGAGYKASLGADAPPGSYEDIDQAELFLVIGSNMADTHPILFLRLMERVQAGAKLIVVDPRRSATADKAHLHLPIRPGSDLALLAGWLRWLQQHGHTDPGFIAQHTEGWDAVSAAVAPYDLARVAALTGLAVADLERAAQWIAQAGTRWVSCWTMGLNQSSHGTANTQALCNLHLATGAIGHAGAGPLSLTGQPNAMGGREMGYMGPGLPGQRSVMVEADRRFTEDVWGLPPGTLRAQAGDGTVALFERMAAGQVAACWIICTNPVASVADRSTVITALARAELVVCQDAFLDTETSRHADILLPGALWAEGDGVMVNSERNLTLAPAATPAPGEALPDWLIICRVAQAMGYAQGFAFNSAAEVFDELARLHNPATGYDLRGASHARLREGPLQWPCPPGRHERRHPQRDRQGGVLRFPTPSGRARFIPCPHREPAEATDAEYGWLLNTGRVQHQWHTLTKTGRVAVLNKLDPGPFIEIHPDDAAALDIRARDRVELRSRRGRAVLPARLSDRVQRGQCFAPFHWNDLYGEDLAVNALTSPAVDPVSLQPEFKLSAVALRLFERATAEPAPRSTLPEPEGDGPPLTVLWASQTGRAEEAATEVARRLRSAGWRVRLCGMDACQPTDLPAGTPLLLLASTFGDGDPPDGARAFWQALQDPSAAHLASSPFAVLAFGDPRYAQFCGFGRQLEARLLALGAPRLAPRVDCPPEHAAPMRRWLTTVAQALQAHRPADARQPALALFDADDDAPEAPAAAVPGTRAHPLPAPLRHNRLLSGPGAGKEVRQFVFDLADTGLHYEAGDALGVWPTNCPALVAELLGLLQLSAAAPVRLDGLGELPLAEAMLRHLEITRLTPELLAGVAERSGSVALLALVQPAQAAALQRWQWGRQPADLLREHPARLGAQEWVDLLPRLQPRLYSIASSPRAHADEVHLTVSTVRYRHGDRLRGGLCSTFLADRTAAQPVPLFVQANPRFRLPEEGDRPVVMIGPGTGVAPFRGFLHERRARGARGANWLFFGEQHAATDFYYRDELQAMQRDGTLQRLSLAFSRDQADKVYVQHRMREQGGELWAWLQDGAHLYVCGDASRMARDVDQALRDVAVQHGGLTPDAAADWLATLTRQRRYLRDVY